MQEHSRVMLASFMSVASVDEGRECSGQTEGGAFSKGSADDHAHEEKCQSWTRLHKVLLTPDLSMVLEQFRPEVRGTGVFGSPGPALGQYCFIT